MSKLSCHDALIHIMVTMSAADRKMSDNELAEIGNIIRSLPIFQGFDVQRLTLVTDECAAILQKENGLDQIIENVRDSLPPNLYETAYALAVDVAAADLRLEQEELRLLQIFRNKLEIDRLIAAAIERGARARHQKL